MNVKLHNAHVTLQLLNCAARASSTAVSIAEPFHVNFCNYQKNGAIAAKTFLRDKRVNLLKLFVFAATACYRLVIG